MNLAKDYRKLTIQTCESNLKLLKNMKNLPLEWQVTSLTLETEIKSMSDMTTLPLGSDKEEAKMFKRAACQAVEILCIDQG